jgi:hypothetical protein
MHYVNQRYSPVQWLRQCTAEHVLRYDSARNSLMAMATKGLAEEQGVLKSANPTAGARKEGLASTPSSPAPGRIAAKRASGASTMHLRSAQTMGTTLTAGGPAKVQHSEAHIYD